MSVVPFSQTMATAKGAMTKFAIVSSLEGLI
jgi:hypothetical protein